MTIETLKQFGADTEDGLARCMNREDFYLKMVNMALKDERFTSLPKALDAGDLDEAFEYSHALKGVIGNLALTPMFDTISELTELLRSKKPGDYQKMFQKVLDQRARLLSMN